MTSKVVNGINVTDLAETMQAIEQDSTIATFKFRAKNKWMGGAKCETKIQDFYGAKEESRARTKPFCLTADEPAVLLGSDQGANATEALLHALASCLSASFIYHASARGVTIESLEFDLEGELDLRGFLGMDESVRNGFSRIRVSVRAKGDAPFETLEELCRLAQKRSPVFDMVTHPTPVEVKLAD